MSKIKFSHNWGGKLSHDFFTTIRKYDDEKWLFYFNKLGAKFEVELNNKVVGKAVLINVEHLKYSEIPNSLLHCDTGIVNVYEIEDLFKRFGIHKQDTVIILTFKRIE